VGISPNLQLWFPLYDNTAKLVSLIIVVSHCHRTEGFTAVDVAASAVIYFLHS